MGTVAEDGGVMSDSVLSGFHPAVRGWFQERFGEATPAQRLGWPAIQGGEHTLILAPTGSGKTLAAFLWGISQLAEQLERNPDLGGVQIVYVSPLKALNNDIERNLREPLQSDGIAASSSLARDLAAWREERDLAVRRYPTRRQRLHASNQAAVAHLPSGRWRLMAGFGIMGPRRDPAERTAARVMAWLNRHGVLSREALAMVWMP